MSIYTISQAAEKLNLCRQTVSLYVKTGKINAIDVGKRKVITAQEIKKFKDKEKSRNEN